MSRQDDFGGGTFLPAFLASESPMAMACFGLVTRLPLRPLLSFPSFIAFISLSTLSPAAGEYFLVDFFAAVGMVCSLSQLTHLR